MAEESGGNPNQVEGTPATNVPTSIDPAVNKKQKNLAILNLGIIVILTILVIVTYYKISIFNTADQIIKILIYTASAGGIGGAVYNIRTFTSQPTTVNVWEIWYLISPIVSIFFGIFSFVLIAGGVLVLSNEQSVSSNTTFFYVGLAFLAGFATENFVQKLMDLAKVFFSSTPSGKN
jgi:hypothetical protein